MDPVGANDDLWYKGLEVKLTDVILHYELAELESDDLLDSIKRGNIEYFHDFTHRRHNALASGRLNDSFTIPLPKGLKSGYLVNFKILLERVYYYTLIHYLDLSN